ncbi:MAG: YicC/YloC family endoribonuclease [Paludibacteraceae bacterium]
MLLSMTGYGKAICEYNNKKITVEIKSLNSKQVDLSTRIANAYREKEIDLRAMVAQLLERGKIDFTLTVEDTCGSAAACINQTIVGNYYKQLVEMSEQLHIPLPVEANLFDTLLRLPDALKIDTPLVDDDEYKVVFDTVGRAIDQLVAFRQQEGAALQRMFTEKLERIGALLLEVDKYESERIAKIRAHLLENLKEIETKVAVDRNRFEQELIYYIEKLDVNEEKVRLRNHLKYFAETMEHEHAAGKKLGFIAQEMGREINTLGSKSNHSEMQIIVVKMKDELEQIKEQVLNVL